MKKHWFKAVLLVLVMSVFLMTTAYAESWLTKLTITDIDAPVAGEAPDTTATVKKTVDSSESEIAAENVTVQWKTAGGEAVDTFVEGENYNLTVTVSAGSGFLVEEGAEVFLNGKQVAYSESSGTFTVPYVYKNVGGTQDSWTVKFMTDGTEYKTYQVADGNKTPTPADPEIADTSFDGWFKDEGFSEAADFSAAITADTTFYAKLTSTVCQHEETEDEITQQPTCTATGLKNIKCKSCGEVLESDVVIDALGHDWGEYAPGDPAPTCTEPGKEVAQCQRDGCDATDERDAPALGHDWGEYVESVAPTCTEMGLEVAECQRDGCDATDERNTDPLGHDWGEYVQNPAPTCTEAGKEVAECQRDGCDATDEKDLDPLGHDWTDWNETKAPTCTAKGEKERTCQREGCDAKETEDVDPIGHTWGEWVTDTAATCEAKGTEIRYCQNDNSHFETRDVDPLGHDWGEWTTVTAATCDNKGLEKRICKNNPNHYEQQETMPIGHKWGDWYTQEQPTCTEPGVARRMCQNNPNHVDRKEIEPTGHSWGNWYKQTPATCTTAGKEVRRCNNDNTHTEERDIPALGHSWGDWYVTKAATQTTPGEMQRRCTVCNQTESKSTNATGGGSSSGGTSGGTSGGSSGYSGGTNGSSSGGQGGWNGGSGNAGQGGTTTHVHQLQYMPAVAATCEKYGSVGYYYCAGCGKKFADANASSVLNNIQVQPLGHLWSNWATSRAATQYQDGEEYRVCTRDSSHRETRSTPKLTSSASTNSSSTYTTTQVNSQAGTTTYGTTTGTTSGTTTTYGTTTGTTGTTGTTTASTSSTVTNGTRTDMGSAIDKKEYAVDQVLHQDWANSKTDTVVITSSLPYTKFRSVEVDGNPLEKANYISTAATGNKTQITLTTQYLQTLSNGEHEVVLNGLAEKSTTNINISGNPVKSDTGEAEVEPTATSRVKDPSPAPSSETDGSDGSATKTDVKQTTAKPAEKKTSSKLPIIIAAGALAAIAAGALVVFKVVLPNKEKNDAAKFKK